MEKRQPIGIELVKRGVSKRSRHRKSFRLSKRHIQTKKLVIYWIY